MGSIKTSLSNFGIKLNNLSKLDSILDNNYSELSKIINKVLSHLLKYNISTIGRPLL